MIYILIIFKKCYFKFSPQLKTVEPPIIVHFYSYHEMLHLSGTPYTIGLMRIRMRMCFLPKSMIIFIESFISIDLNQALVSFI